VFLFRPASTIFVLHWPRVPLAVASVVLRPAFFALTAVIPGAVVKTLVGQASRRRTHHLKKRFPHLHPTANSSQAVLRSLFDSPLHIEPALICPPQTFTAELLVPNLPLPAIEPITAKRTPEPPLAVASFVAWAWSAF
jgi:hypothetical protein